MPKVYATITFEYEMDDSDTTDEMPISEQIRTDQDELREMVKRWFSGAKVKVDNLDAKVEIA